MKNKTSLIWKLNSWGERDSLSITVTEKKILQKDLNISLEPKKYNGEICTEKEQIIYSFNGTKQELENYLDFKGFKPDHVANFEDTPKVIIDANEKFLKNLNKTITSYPGFRTLDFYWFNEHLN